MKWKPLLTVTAVFVFAANGPLYGQISAQSGAISGRVTDSTGAVVPGATVAITSGRGVTQSKKTGDTGDFVFPLLDPGSYRVTITASGFSESVLMNVPVKLTEVTNIPVNLTLGTATIEVTVSDEVIQLNTTNATLGEVIPGQVVEKLPLPTRNFTGLLGTNAATAMALPDASTVGRASSTVFVNGQRGTMNNFVINGIDANNLGNNNSSSIPIPSPDSIEEFRVQTSMYDASMGKTSGGNINVITKGGTEQYHDELYEFFRNEDLNANSFFFNKAGAAKPIVRQNQFGGNFGGPVPKWKDTFFFGSYQGTRQLNGLSGAITTAWPVLPVTRDAASIASAFGISPSQVDPVALKLLNQHGQYGGYIVPSGAGADPGKYGNIAVSAPIRFNDDQFNTNGDKIINDKNRLGLRYFRAVASQFDPLGGQGTGNFGNGLNSPIRNHLASISETWTASPTIVNEFRFGFNRIITANVSNEPVKLSDIGMSRFNSSLYQGIPVIDSLDLSPGFGGESTNYDQAGYSNTLHISDTLSLVRGQHSVRVGFESRLYQINLFNNFASRGFLYFATFKDFIEGNIYQAFAGTGQTYRDYRAHDVSWFIADDYKINRRLTVNLGLRYDYLGGTTDKRHRIGNFDPNLLDANVVSNGGPGLLNGFVLPASADFGSIKGTPGVSESTYSVDNNMNWAPRIGFVFDPKADEKTSIRGGYGVYYVRISNQTLLQLITAAPFFQLSSVVNPGTPFSNPYPNLPLPSQFPIYPALPAFQGYNPAGSPLFSAALLSLNPIQRNLGTPYAEHYNFSISRELPGRLALELGYVGSQGVKLLQSLQENQALLVNPSNPIRGLTANSSRNASARVGLAGFSTTGFNEVTGNGHSTFNAFTASLNRRYGRSFLQTSYTFSKSIDNNSGSPTQDLGSSGGNHLWPTLQRGLSDFDRTHRLLIAYSYDLPGLQKSFARWITRGWSISGLTTFQSAPPINFICSVCTTNIYGNTTPLYPNVVGNFKTIQKSGDPHQFLDPGTSVWNSGIVAGPPILTSGTVVSNLNLFGGPGPNSYPIGGPGPDANNTGQLLGTMPRNPGIRGPFQQQWDFTVARTFSIAERVKFDLRADFFNLFNHPVFATTTSTSGSGNSAIATVGSPAFGRYTLTATAPRIVGFIAKFRF